MKPNELDALIEDCLEGRLSEADAARLSAALQESPEARTRYWESASIHGLLEQTMQQASLRVITGQASPRPTRWFQWRPLAAAAALVLLAGLAVWFVVHPAERAVAVEILASDGASRFVAGQKVKLRSLMLESGSVRFRLNSGVVCDAAGPAEIELINAMRLRLVAGRLSADVGERGKGFTVITDAGEVVDLGTRFGVEAERGGESRVAVFSGKVKVRAGAAQEGHPFTTLSEGEAVRFTKRDGMRRWPQVALAAEAAGLASQPKDGVLSDVRDNLGYDGLRPYYGVVAGGMGPGAIAFTDKPNSRWAPLPGDTLPDGLAGADLIRMYVNFRHKMSYELTLTLREAVTVFVLIDARQTPPDWLVERFTKMPPRVRVGPGTPRTKDEDGVEIGPDGRPYRWFDVWSAEAGAGEFKLGPARTVRGTTAPLMYGVAVKPRVTR